MLSPVPAAESRRLAMVDGVSIVLDHAKRYDTPRIKGWYGDFAFNVWHVSEVTQTRPMSH